MTLREWTRRGILPPPIEAVRGRGNVMKYPRSALRRAELARRLRAEGWTIDSIAAYMQARTWDEPSPDDPDDDPGPDDEPSPDAPESEE